jgi:hypothetical protein
VEVDAAYKVDEAQQYTKAFLTSDSAKGFLRLGKLIGLNII